MKLRAVYEGGRLRLATKEERDAIHLFCEACGISMIETSRGVAYCPACSELPTITRKMKRTKR